MNNDVEPKLRQALQSWEVVPPPAPNFKSNVWRRIAAEEERAARPWEVRLRDFFFTELPKPAYAIALLLLTAVISTTAASIRADQTLDQYRLDSAREYLASINPISMAAQMSPVAR